MIWHDRTRRDLSLLGVALFGAAVVLTYGMYLSSSAGLVSLLVCKPLFTMFADFAWLVPVIVALIGIILICEASEPTVIMAMSTAAVCYLLLFATIYHLGTVGQALAQVSSFLFGDFANAVTYGLLSILTFSMMGVSLREIIVQAWRVSVGVFRFLWDLRLPHPSTFFASGKRSATDNAASTPVPIALPPRISIKREEPIIDAVFVDVPVSHAVRRGHGSYRLPHLSLLNQPAPVKASGANSEQLIIDTLASFGVGVTIKKVTVGSSLTRYEIIPDKGVPVKKITEKQNDIALALAAESIRIQAPIPGKAAVGIEVPNATPAVVTIREILEAVAVRDSLLTVALGKDVTGKPITADLREMPHLLVAGATGSGKSVCLNNIIASLLISSTPEQVQMLFIDPKRVELSIYRGIPHLLRPVVTDTNQAVGALQQMAREMDARYKTFEQAEVNKIEDYNAQFPSQKLPYIVVVIDELADLMTTAGEAVEAVIIRLTQLARATGIHLVVATQRPTVDVITGLIKANIPSRIAFAVASQVDSRTILDVNGAEQLMGRGDMLFKPIDAMKATRLQGGLITSKEIKRLVSFWSAQSPVSLPESEPDGLSTHAASEANEISVDPLTREASRYVISLGQASTAKMKERFQLGHTRASRLIQTLEELGIVGPSEGRKPRRVLVTADQLDGVLAGRGA